MATETAPRAELGADGVGDPILAVDGVVKTFGGVHALDGATLAVERRSITALIGPNGAGKTTLFHVVSGFLHPDAGSVQLDGEEIAGRAPEAIARRGLVRTFQISKALARMSVLDNLMLAAPDHPGERLRSAALHPRAALRRERQARRDALELLELFTLADQAHSYAGTLSGGQRKLLELARSLMAQPRVLLLDEPVAGINRTLGATLLEHIRRVRAERDVTFLFVEHDMDVVMTTSDRVIVMAEGRVIAAGPPATVRTDPRVIDAYLGVAAGSQTA